MANILVTGGCGYIGSHLVKLLGESGEKVTVLDNLTTGHKHNLLHNEKLFVGDIRDISLLTEIFESGKFDIICHLAALVNAAESISNRSEYQKVNATGSENIWQIAKKFQIKHILYASSAAVYGTPISDQPIIESHPLKPTNPYGDTKLAGEYSLTKYFKHYTVFRFFNVGGSEEKGKLGQSITSPAIIPRLLFAAKNNTPITIYGNNYNTADGTVVRDFIHVEDIASAFLLAIKNYQQASHRLICNLGSSQPTTMLQLHKLVEKITGKTIPLKFAQPHPGDITYSLADISKAKEALSWKPSHSLESVIKTSWDHYLLSSN